MEKKECPSIRLLFVGAPLLDIVAHCGQDVLDKYRLKLDDCVKATEEHEDLIQAVFNHPESQLSAGGSSLNTARVAKWTLAEKADVSFTGCVGQDDFANRMSQCLLSEKVEPLFLPLAGESTGVCVCILNSEGHRSMCARLGAAAFYAEHHLLEQQVRERLIQAQCIFVEGYFFAHSPRVMQALVEMCSPNQLLSVSLSAEYICRDHSKALLRVLPRVDVLLSNKVEAKAMVEALGLGNQATVENIACELATRDSGNRIVIVTQGSDPVLVVQGTGKPRYFPVSPGIKVVDSVGCGDALAGAFLAVYTLTRDIEKAVRTGIAAAAEITQVTGCNPTKKKLYPLDGDDH